MPPSVHSKQDYDVAYSPEVAGPSAAAKDTRPRIEFTSAGAFSTTLWRRFASIWTRRFTLSLIAGQIVSLCITCTNVATTELVSRNWSLPTTQTFFL
ncbi:hypothetical protein FIBSPDRAFT_865801, partial [Athelia psychrophila]